MADSEEVFICSPIGLNNLIVVVRRESFSEKFRENPVPVSAEGMARSEVVFLEFLAIQNGNCHRILVLFTQIEIDFFKTQCR
jgi:hypothetical protein